MRKPSKNIKSASDTSGLLPYDNLVSNRGSQMNIYFERVMGRNPQLLQLEEDPMKQNNDPLESMRTMADEREAIEKPLRRGSIRKQKAGMTLKSRRKKGKDDDDGTMQHAVGAPLTFRR